MVPKGQPYGHPSPKKCVGLMVKFESTSPGLPRNIDFFNGTWYIYLYMKTPKTTTQVNVGNCAAIPWEPKTPTFFGVISPIYWGFKNFKTFIVPWVKQGPKVPIEHLGVWERTNKLPWHITS